MKLTKRKYTWEEFDKDTYNLIRRIKYTKFEPATIVSIATGGLILGTKLKNKLKTPLVIISANSYEGKEKKQLTYNVSFTKPLESPILLVDDICDTGDTMNQVYNHISSLGIVIKTASLFYKERSSFKPNWYSNLVADNTWVQFPWE